MASNLRVGHTHGYHLYREVEPVPAYPRIDPQQPRDEQYQQRKDFRARKENLARRRFNAMRDLIDELKQTAQIVRVDYATAARELCQIGIALADKELLELLRTLEVTAEGMSHLARQIGQAAAHPDLDSGPVLLEANHVLPWYTAGLSEFHLRFFDLELLPGQEGPLLLEAIASDGLYRSSGRDLRLECRPLVKAQYDTALRLDIRIVVGVSEVDEANRRVILYRRTPAGYALYADRQINLSI